MKKEVKQTITVDELKTLLKALFDLYEFQLTNITLNNGLNSRWEGCGMAEHEVTSAYFKGITVNVTKKKNQKVIQLHPKMANGLLPVRSKFTHH